VSQYARYMYKNSKVKSPASWSQANCDQKPANGVNGFHTNGTHAGHANGDGHTNGRTNGTATHGTEQELPESFLADKSVRTVYGLVPLKFALDWPVFASYDELAGCAAYMGGRIPTFEEARSIYTHSELQNREEAERQLGKTVPAVNG
jgi:L-histidine Nalpha-methyltransferase / hercynylcysteine S-oxide synthase